MPQGMTEDFTSASKVRDQCITAQDMVQPHIWGCVTHV